MDRRRRNALHAKMLGIGLGISLVVHVTLLALGRISFGTGDTQPADLSVVTLPEATPPEEDATEPPASGQLAIDLSFNQAELPAVLELTEYRDVLAEAMSPDPLAPLVPQPRLRAELLESGLTPLHVPRPDRLTRRAGGTSGDGGGGLGGVIIIIGNGGMGGVDKCVPPRPGGRYPTGRR